MLKLNSKGLLVPNKPIVTTVKEMRTFFVDGIESDTRITNFQNYIRYSDELKELLEGTELKQWLNGSFVTKKKNPKDIDLVTFIDYSIVQMARENLYEFVADKAWENYAVDAYIIEVHSEDSPLYQFSKSDTLEWFHLFSRTRRNRRGNIYPKGFLEIYY